MNIKRNGTQPAAKEPADCFTGSVTIDAPFKALAPGRAGGATVTFEPGARTAWHTHPLGQTLIVFTGYGRVQRAGGPRRRDPARRHRLLRAGRKLWHGGSPTTAMTHVAIAESPNGKVVEWMEHVTDEQYRPESPLEQRQGSAARSYITTHTKGYYDAETHTWK